MKDSDIRWIQRFDNFGKALNRLEEAICVISDNAHSENIDLLKEGLIQRFEFTHELAWKVMKDYMEYQGNTDIRGSRDAFRKSLAIGLIDSTIWIDSIQTRTITSHTYDEEITNEPLLKIISTSFPLIKEFENKMLSIIEDEAE